MIDSFSTELIQRLHQAGRQGLSKSKLIAGKGRLARSAAVQNLLDAERIANLGTEKKPLFVLPQFYKPVDCAREIVEEKARPGTPRLFSRREIGKGCKGAVLDCLGTALSMLLAERRLIHLQRGKSVYFLHSASIEPLVHFSSAPAIAGSGESSNGNDLPVERVRDAYLSIVRETGFSDILISDLQKRSGVHLDTLKAWLIEQSCAGHVLPTRGDWSLADSDARAASLMINSEPHLRVRVCGTA